MAKRSSRKRRSFSFETLSQSDAKKRFSKKGSRRSKYSPIGDQLEALRANQVLAFEASKNEVQGIRNYISRNYGSEYKVSSRSTGSNSFEVHIFKNK